jgi:hypothetical protein
LTEIVKSTLGHEKMPRKLLLSRRIISGVAAGGFRVDSPVRNPVASEMARSSPPYTDPAREEPWEGASDEIACEGKLRKQINA